jgi:RNA recognition motif-containing protein
MAQTATRENQCNPRKIFIGGLAHKTTTHQLSEYFSRYGTIVDAVVLRWSDGRSRGFGYVTFADKAEVTAALRVAHQIGGRHIDVKRAVPGTHKLFVGGLPKNIAATELREHFEAFGVVSDAMVMMDSVTGRSRGFGFVCYMPGQEGAAAVAAALEQYNNHYIRGKWIEVKSAASPHNLAAKEGCGGSYDGVCASVSTTAGTSDESQTADSESESSSVISGPVVNVRPVASSHGCRLVPTKPNKFSGHSPHVEHCKVSLLRTTIATRQQQASVTIGKPPGLDVPSQATDSLPVFLPELSLLPRQAPLTHARLGQTPWPASCTSVLSMHRHMLSTEPVSAKPAAQQWCPSFGSAHAQPMVKPDPKEWGSQFLQDSSSLSAARHSLQRSLEQLLKQHSLHAAGEGVESGGSEIRAPEESAIHGGPQ